MSRTTSSESDFSREGDAFPGFTSVLPAGRAQDATCLAVEANRRFYDALWSASYVVQPQRFNTWPLLSTLAASAPARLEIGPGLRPRLPIAGTSFVDISRPALSRLTACGGLAMLGEITALPYPDRSFNLVCAFDIVEHVEDDQQVFRELSRVVVPSTEAVWLEHARGKCLREIEDAVSQRAPGDLPTDPPRRARSTLRSRRSPGHPGRASFHA